MSDLIPNLDALRAKVPAGQSASDTHEFVEELAKAGSVAEISANVDALVDRWLELLDDSE